MSILRMVRVGGVVLEHTAWHVWWVPCRSADHMLRVEVPHGPHRWS